MIYTEFSLIHAQIILRLEASIVWIFNILFGNSYIPKTHAHFLWGEYINYNFHAITENVFGVFAHLMFPFILFDVIK